jgi:asparagine synthase (glutamine-hydrolysing)
MCGIAGWIGHLSNAERVGQRMIKRLRHRGPDAHGLQTWAEATLVHTRLSILDLSPAGSQPMENEDGTVWTVFNGEIYNHRELRRYLQSRGHKFKGRSDTEILPHLYEEHGVSFTEKLRGMFALAIYDRQKQILLLARDRFGIKPLFYSPQKTRIAFASEIRALLEFPDIDEQPDKQAIYDFAMLSYIPAPETFYKGIRALQAGEILVAQLQQDHVDCQVRAFHHWRICPNQNLTLGQAAEETEARITTAVHRQLESDVPLGALLSGGIDSSLVSVAAQEVFRGGIRTFNVRFPDDAYDETWAALSVAEHIGSHHETLEFRDAEGNWEFVTDLLAHSGQPFADTSIFAVNALCRLIRKHVTVALSGDGGDEGFGGYGHYWEIARIANLQRFPSPLWHAGATLLGPLANLGIVPHRFPRQLSDFAGADDTAVLQNLFSYLRNDEHAALFADSDVLPVRRLFEPQWDYQLPSDTSRLDRLSAQATEVNVRLTLANDFLFKVDAASMRESLEVRVPMLDEDLFDFALTLPHGLKVKNRSGKRVLREVAKRKLPPSVAEKPKMGFAVPVDTWLNAEFRDRLKDVLLGASSELNNFFQPQIYRPWVESFCNGDTHSGLSRRDTYRRVMMLLSVQLALASPS